MDTKITMTNKAFKVFFIIDLGVIIFCVLSSHYDWLLNTQIAFFSSLMVTIGSYLGYKKNVSNAVENQMNEDDNYDEIDKMDDKYDLYSPEVETKIIDESLKAEATKEEIQEAIKNNNAGSNIDIEQWNMIINKLSK